MIRIVKLTLDPNHLDDFINHFETVKDKINRFPGCLGMQLLLDKKTKGILFTYSEWENEEALNNYRNSELFGQIWPTVKQWFISKPEAWSTSCFFNGFKS